MHNVHAVSGSLQQLLLDQATPNPGRGIKPLPGPLPAGLVNIVSTLASGRERAMALTSMRQDCIAIVSRHGQDTSWQNSMRLLVRSRYQDTL
jgi:hypothetical protein